MKVEELMIDDWVLVKGKPVRVDDIDVAEGINREWIAGCEDGGCILEKDIEPLPITEEILDSLSNKKEISVFTNKPYWYEQNAIHDISIQQCGSVNVYLLKIITVNHYEIKIPVRYIHEIQHAFLLAGIRKEIVL